MADDRTKTGKADDARINVEEAHELPYWSQKFGVTRDELRAAVDSVGPMVKDVQRILETESLDGFRYCSTGSLDFNRSAQEPL